MDPRTERALNSSNIAGNRIFETLEETGKKSQTVLMEICRFTKGYQYSFGDVSLFWTGLSTPTNTLHLSIGGDELEFVFRFYYEMELVSSHRTGIGKILGKSKSQMVEVRKEKQVLSLWDYHGHESLENVARAIHARGSFVDAKRFAEFCRRLDEVPSNLVRYLAGVAQTANSSLVSGFGEEVDLKCSVCGAPNRKLTLFCEYCGQPTVSR